MPAATRITHIIVRLSTGGAEKSLYRLLRHTRDEFLHEVICFGQPTTIGQDIEALGIKVHWLNERRAGPLVLWQAWRMLRANPPHILQGWMYYGNLLASLLGRCLSASTRVAWNIRQAPADFRREKARTRWAMAWARAPWLAPDLVIYNSHAGQRVHLALGYNKYPHTVIANGIDLDEFAPDAKVREQVRAAWGIGAERWVAMVCRYHPLKGVGQYLAAVRCLLDAGCRARFALAGSGMRADNAELAGLMQQHGLDETEIALLGEIASPADFLPALDVLVQASWREGTPNILLEAMACGVLTIATRVGDSERIISDAARLVSPGDSQALAAAIAAALAAAPADAECGGGARQQDRVDTERAFLRAHYETGLCMQAYRHAYEKLLGAVA